MFTKIKKFNLFYSQGAFFHFSETTSDQLDQPDNSTPPADGKSSRFMMTRHHFTIKVLLFQIEFC